MIIVKTSGIDLSEDNGPMVEKGPVLRKVLIDAKPTGEAGVVVVSFKPGARLAFHKHNAEQILICTDGKGIVATKTEEKVITPGMVAYIPAGEVHYHGATKPDSFTHIAIYKGASEVVN
jgi:quercetin dioxygenase-like cupin family protein